MIANLEIPYPAPNRNDFPREFVANDVSCPCSFLMSSINFATSAYRDKRVGGTPDRTYHEDHFRTILLSKFADNGGLPALVTLTIASLSDQSFKSGNGLSSTLTSCAPWKTTALNVSGIWLIREAANWRGCGEATGTESPWEWPHPRLGLCITE